MRGGALPVTVVEPHHELSAHRPSHALFSMAGDVLRVLFILLLVSNCTIMLLSTARNTLLPIHEGR
jgi:hypothetical protein